MPKDLKTYEYLKKLYLNLPHCRALGLAFAGEEGRMPVLSADWRGEFVGNNLTQVVHGGVITALADVAGAMAVAAHLSVPEFLATLDLRIDYLYPAVPQQRLFARAHCYRLSGQIAFVRTVCFRKNADDPFALATATYMRTPMPEEWLEKWNNA